MAWKNPSLWIFIYLGSFPRPPLKGVKDLFFVPSPATLNLKYKHPCVVINQMEESIENENMLNEMFGPKEPDEDILNEIIKQTVKTKKFGRPKKEEVERKGFQVF